jgi:hypothetical protein
VRDGARVALSRHASGVAAVFERLADGINAALRWLSHGALGLEKRERKVVGAHG